MKRGTGKAASMTAGLVVGAVVSLIVTVLGAFLGANLIVSEKISEASIGYCSMIIILLSSSLGALLAACMIKHRWLPVCLGAGGIYYLILLATTALFFGGQYQGMGVTALAVLGGCGTVGLLGINRGEGKSRKRKKRSFR